MELTDSAELCGVPGHEDEQITKGELNRFVRTVNVYHGRPIKKELRNMNEALVEHHKILLSHIESDAIFTAKMAGAKWALYAIIAMLAPVVPLLYYLIKALTQAGVL